MTTRKTPPKKAHARLEASYDGPCSLAETEPHIAVTGVASGENEHPAPPFTPSSGVRDEAHLAEVELQLGTGFTVGDFNMEKQFRSGTVCRQYRRDQRPATCAHRFKNDPDVACPAVQPVTGGCVRIKRTSSSSEAQRFVHAWTSSNCKITDVSGP